MGLWIDKNMDLVTAFEGVMVWRRSGHGTPVATQPGIEAINPE